MKMCNKVLAVILSLIMLLSAVPMAAFASAGTGNGASGGASGGSTGGLAAIPSAPIDVAIPLGTGADGTITVTIDAKDILLALKNDRSVDALIDLVRDAISVSDSDIVTINDIMELVPMSSILTSLLGENNEHAADLIAQFGGLDELMKMLDRDELIVTANKQALLDFILSLDDPLNMVYIDNIIALDIEWDLQKAYEYANQVELQARIRALTYDDLKELVGGQASNLKKLVYYDSLLEELLAQDKIDDSAMNVDKLLADHQVIKDALITAAKNDFRALLTEAGLQKVENDLFARATEYFATHPLTLADMKDHVISDLLHQVLGANVSDYLFMDAALADPTLKGYAEAELNSMIAGMTPEEKLDLLTDEAKEDLLLDPDMTITVDHLTQATKVQVIENVFIDHTGESELFDRYVDTDRFLEDHEADIIHYFEQDARAYLEQGTPTTYIKEEKINAVIADYVGGLSYSFFNKDTDFNTAAVVEVVLNTAKANSIELLDYLVDGFDPFAIEGVTSIIMANVNWDAVNNPEIVNRTTLLNKIVGTGSIFDLIPEANMEAYLTSVGALDTVFAMIQGGTVALENVVNVELLLNSIPAARYGELLNLFDRSVLVAQLAPHAATLAGKLTQEQIKQALVPVMSSLLQNINLISLDGYAIAKEKEAVPGGDPAGAGLLTFDPEALLNFVLTKIPSLSDLAEKEEPILSFNIYIQYKTAENQEDRTKDINFALTFGGDLDLLRVYLLKLADFFGVSKVGNQIYVNMKLPYVLTQAYTILLSSEKGASIRNQILALAGKDGGDVSAALAELSLEDIITLLRQVNFADLYETVMNVSKVEAVLERIFAATGLNIRIEDIQDLDVVVDKLASTPVSLEIICEAVEKATKRDIMKYLEGAASFADKNATVQALLDRLAGVPYFGKFINENTLSEILENYKDADPVDAVVNFINAKVGKDIREIVLKYDVDEIYQKALDYASAYEYQFNRIKNFALNALDPTYVPTGKWDTVVDKLIPDMALQYWLATSVSDFYQGNGTFGASADSLHLDLTGLATKLLQQVFNRVNIGDQYEDMILGAIPQKTLDLGIHVKLTFQGISQVEYYDHDNNLFVTTYLPNGLNPAKYVNTPAVAGKTFLYWTDVYGNPVDKITGDMKLYAVYAEDGSPDVYYTVTILEKGAAEGYTIRVKENDYINASEFPNIPQKEGYRLLWYVDAADGEEITKAEILNMKITRDITFVYEYKLIPVYTVTILLPNGTVFGTYQVTENKLFSLPDDLPTPGALGLPLADRFYKRVWFVDSLTGTSVTEAAIESTPVTADVTYIFNYVEKQYFTVTFKDQNGKVYEEYEQLVLEGESLSNNTDGRLPVPPSAEALGLAQGPYLHYDLFWAMKIGNVDVPEIADSSKNQVMNKAITANTVITFIYRARDTYDVVVTAPEAFENDDWKFEIKVIKGYSIEEMVARLTEWKNNGTDLDLSKLPEISKLPSSADMDYHNGRFGRVWQTAAGVSVSENTVFKSGITAAVTYIFDYALLPDTQFFTEMGNRDIIVDHDLSGNWKISVQGHASFHLLIDRAKFAEFVDAKSLKIDTDDVTMSLDHSMILQILAALPDDGKIELGAESNYTISFGNQFFRYSTNGGYSFMFKINGVDFVDNFTGDMNITVPFANWQMTSGETYQTVVCVIKDGAIAEYVDASKIGYNVETGMLSFSAPHFSDFVVMNRTKWVTTPAYANGTIAVSSNLDGQWFPADATVTVLPEITSGAYGKFIKELLLVDADGTIVGRVDRIGATIQTPDAGYSLKVVVEDLPFNTYYVIGDNLYTADEVAEHLNEIVVPLGYKLVTDQSGAVEWVNQSIVDETLYLTPKFEIVNYTINFAGITTPFTFNVNTFAAQELPKVPTVAGKIGAWDLPATLDAIIAKFGDTTVLDVAAVYTGKTYQAHFPNEVKDLACGEEVTLGIVPSIGHTITSIKVINLSNPDEVVAIVNGKFVMPDSDVKIEVVEVADQVTYTITNIANNEVKTFKAPYGSNAVYTIEISKGSALVGAPAMGKLISFKINDDGSKTLTYTVVVDYNTAVLYKVLPVTAANVAFADGSVTGSLNPSSVFERLSFAGFSSPESLRFESVNYQFATYTRTTDPASFIWLWILLAVILLIALIALFYILFIRGILKACIFTSIIVAIVNVFFKACLGISGLVLKITQGTTKKDEVDFNDYGVDNPEAEATEEAADEPTEEAAEEATEEAAEEADSEKKED